MPGPILREYWTGNRAFWLVHFGYWPSDCLSRVINQHSYMAPRLLGQTSIFCVVFLHPSLFKKLKDKRNFKIMQFWPESLGSMLEYWYMVIYRTWLLYLAWCQITSRSFTWTQELSSGLHFENWFNLPVKFSIDGRDISDYIRTEKEMLIPNLVLFTSDMALQLIKRLVVLRWISVRSAAERDFQDLDD